MFTGRRINLIELFTVMAVLAFYAFSHTPNFAV